MEGKNAEERMINEKFEKEVLEGIKNQGYSVRFCSKADELEEALEKEGDNIVAVMVLCLPGRKSMNTRLLDYSLLKSSLLNIPFYRCQLARGTVLYGILRREGKYFFEVPKRTLAKEFHPDLLLAV